MFEGTSVRIAPDGVRAFQNTSASEDLYFIVIQAKENSLTQWVETDGIILEQPVEWGKSLSNSRGPNFLNHVKYTSFFHFELSPLTLSALVATSD